MGKLKALQINTLAEGRHSDGDGLILNVRSTGSRNWILRVQINGRRRDIGLGDAKTVSLREAREAAAEMRKLARAGIDPLDARKSEKQTIEIPTFREASKLLHAEQKKGWKNGKHGDQWLTTLEKHAWPGLGDMKVDAIEGPVIRDVLAGIWLEIPETARRVKQRIGAVLDWCYVKGQRSSEAPMRSLVKGLPRQPRKNGHFAAMDYAAVPKFLLDLRERKLSVSRLALEFLVLTAVRSGEVRRAGWSEFNTDFSLWTIPAERMKMGKVHTVPLSAQAREVIKQAASFRAACSDLVFPGQRPINPMSDMTLLQLVRGMDLPVTVHGFRSSFRDWVADKTDFPGEVAEAALAHALENKVEAAYRRTDFLEKRRVLMAAWADYCLPRQSLAAVA